MNRKKIVMNGLTLLMGLWIGLGAAAAQLKVMPNSYAVLIRDSLAQHTEWSKVAARLSELHQEAPIFTYKLYPAECKAQLQGVRPRFVAIVETPENLNKKYVIDLNMLSRQIDDDIYRDFMWGIVTGYTPQVAMRVVEDATKPLAIESLVSTISELTGGEWFQEMVDIEDQSMGTYWTKKRGEVKPVSHQADALKGVMRRGEPAPDLLPIFHNAMRALEPDLVVTASHATERNLEMPYSVGNIKAVSGMLYTDFRSGAKPLFDADTELSRKVYLPIGNCLIGNMNGTKHSMACGWISSGGASCMIGYVVPTWYGRGGWGGLKYFLTNSGRLSCYPAFLLNDQEILHKLHKELPALDKEPYKLDMDYFTIGKKLQKLLGKNEEVDVHQIGFYYDRDVLAYYGDPAWEITLPAVEQYTDYSVNYQYTPKELIITVTTDANFRPENYKGRSWKDEHVDHLPLAFYFPQRVDKPTLKAPRKVKMDDYILEENSLLIYNPDLKPGKTYVWKVRSGK